MAEKADRGQIKQKKKKEYRNQKIAKKQKMQVRWQRKHKKHQADRKFKKSRKPRPPIQMFYLKKWDVFFFCKKPLNYTEENEKSDSKHKSLKQKQHKKYNPLRFYFFRRNSVTYGTAS